MPISVSTRIAYVLATLGVVLAVASPAAADDWGRQQLDPSIQVAMDQRRDRLDPAIVAAISARETLAAATQRSPVVEAPTPSDGFSWGDAGIGAAATGLAAILVALVSLVAVRRRSTLRHA
jgi:hypothetical protein